MSKADQRKRRERKKAAKAQAEFAAAVALSATQSSKPKSRGATRMREIEADQYKATMETRARKAGKEPGEWREMAHVAHGEAAGRALMLSCTPETAETLWAAYKALSAAYRAFTRLNLGLDPYAKCPPTEYRPNKVEVRPDDRPDLRSPEERAADARRAWAEWDVQLDRLAFGERALITAVAVNSVTPVTDTGEVTAKGRAFVAAMKRLCEVDTPTPPR